MNLKELGAKFSVALAPLYGKEEVNGIFLLVIEYYLKLNRSIYSLKKEYELTDNELKTFEFVLDQIITGKPIQYILGETVFYGLTFKVTEAVLIPRPETEELVEWVIERIESLKLKIENSESKTHNAYRQPINLLDIGTGSGCIAISLKKNLPKANVFAMDISTEALTIAKRNAVLNNVNVSFMEQDILLNSVSILDTRYSILVSNPPYITQTEKAQMHENVLKNEPHLALFVSNEDPLIFYEAIADFALINLKENGLLFFEINEHHGEKTVKMLSGKGFNAIELRKDMQGKDRMICCSRN
ncbi:MAG: peptide chain release factor N(5)-glutamine methyltransferase [Pedobacter sp.]|nr:peptide chain release factor N(5)-glutamine methyltransferase [Pedobacter sp.]